MKIYYYNSLFSLRAIVLDNKVYVVGKDLARILGYKKERGAIQRHVSNRNKSLCYVPDSRNQMQKTVCISIEGALELINTCKAEQTPLVRNWFNTQVLPDAMRDMQMEEAKEDYVYWMTPVYTYKDIQKRLNVDTNVLTDFLMNHYFMDEKFHLMNKGIFIVDHRFTRVGYEFVKEMMKVEGFKK